MIVMVFGYPILIGIDFYDLNSQFSPSIYGGEKISLF